MIKVRANSKINLTLNVVGIREDGYHLLNTIMQSIGICDYVTVEKAEKILLEGIVKTSGVDENIPWNESNLAYKAATAFFDFTGIKSGCNIKVEKHIPSQAGLGGGSADAAAVLVALNEVYGTKISVPALMRLGASLGADVPFCIAGGTKLCTGIGENIKRSLPLMNCFLVIAKPDVSVSTPYAYGLIDKNHITVKEKGDIVASALKEKKLGVATENMFNIFEEVIKDQKILAIKQHMLEYGALNALMTGSGSAVFGVFENHNDADRCFNSLESLPSVIFRNITHPSSKGCIIEA